MLYLSGAKVPELREHLAAGHVGLLTTPGTRYDVSQVKVFAVDNGCFGDNPSYPGDDGYLRFLASMDKHRDRALFAAVTDVVGDGPATLALFPAMAKRIAEAGWPVALVAQDGMTADQIPWHDVDWLFIGGSDEWKLGMESAELIRVAKLEGCQVHVGRVNSLKRFSKFAAMGVDTADGTFIKFGPSQNTPKVLNWMAAPQQINMMPPLATPHTPHTPPAPRGLTR
jgi:hypothetical protein